jgi:putative membrane protein
MKIALALVAAAAAPLIAAPAATAQAYRGQAGPMDPTPTMAMPYVMKAGASDLYEIQSSRLALQKSRDQRVRSLAQMLITHHQMTTRDLTAAARRAGMRPRPPMLEPHQAAMIADLRRATARGFDRAFLDQQRTAHMEALNLHRTYARNGDRPALRMAADKTVPIIQRHIDRISAITVR